MAQVRAKDTGPERIVRSLTHRLGYRFALHRRDLPGSPDLVFPCRKKVIFVHGCFWHQHARCARSAPPSSRRDYWLPKLEKNRLRDRRNVRDLRRLGWNVLTLWECQLKDPDRLRTALEVFLQR
jgi:DNA mismatch endonuclease, patch repair protein